MRRLTVTTFALLYAFLLVAGSAGRSFSWALKEADALAQLGSHHNHAFHNSEKSGAHLLQIKLTETEFVVAHPEDVSASPTLAAGDRLCRLSENPLWRPCQTASSRAPPSII